MRTPVGPGSCWPRRSVREPTAAGGADGARVEGTVRAQLPSGLYEVDVDGARITAHAGGSGKGGAERNFVRLLVGDRVVVELMPRDLTRGRIVKKA
jgi:translation initiation factor IF-1